MMAWSVWGYRLVVPFARSSRREGLSAGLFSIEKTLLRIGDPSRQPRPFGSNTRVKSLGWKGSKSD